MYDKFGIGDIHLEEANIIKSPVTRVDPSTKVVDAFRKMRIQEINGLAIADDNGTLLGTLSESDLRGITMENMSLLQHPVIDFLKTQNNNTVPEVITVRSTTLLRDLLEIITKRKLHRVFVIDDTGRATGVITLTDIIAYFWNRTMNYWFDTE